MPDSGAPVIQTERLLLRPHVREDFDDLHKLGSDPAVFRFTGGGKASSEEENWRRLLFYIGHWQALRFGLFTVRDAINNAFLGEGGIMHFHRGIGAHFDLFPEAAWRFLPSAQGKGYAFEAVSAFHAWFKGLPPVSEKTVCMIHPDNSASLKLADKLGYRPYGVAKYKDEHLTLFERQVSRDSTN
ncbi:hypothetical protein FP2506_01490 [Fulvimarina pelagi HTCC2506]|uniref:N-acetyltransferase domain-containing protein n=1 Tax=Fulvimarina pelagi HTCC2506 TaxID=314231 RepID=Q0G1Z9_9HYPH|nr:GNAT family N-acetyltransferase [Fulvimarina pelagi]EAU41399.1 hypothetical protein FP2506_01490 [Fulvimarina pelagi HTCC2506]